MYESVNEELLDFLNESPDAFHAADQIRRILKQNGFEELAEGNVWNLAKGGKYFVLRNESSVIAFAIPKTDFQGFMIGAAHSDSPSFKIKENPEIKKEGYITLNVEKYGGMLMSTWFDRPLSVAGRVLVRDGNRIMTKLVNVDRDLVQIVNLAIHMDRTANSGHEINVQNEMEPILGLEGSEGSFMKIIAEAAGVKPEDILGRGPDVVLIQPVGLPHGLLQRLPLGHALPDFRFVHALSRLSGRIDPDQLVSLLIHNPGHAVSPLGGAGQPVPDVDLLPVRLLLNLPGCQHVLLVLHLKEVPFRPGRAFPLVLRQNQLRPEGAVVASGGG